MIEIIGMIVAIIILSIIFFLICALNVIRDDDE